MDRIAQWPAADREELFVEAAADFGISPAVVEKDFWVCWLLDKLFADNTLADKILLKGGTSLSKVFGLIKRFSEDIDLILDWRELTNEDPYLERSKTKQDRFNKAMLNLARSYIKNTFLARLAELMSGICSARINESAPDIVAVRYPTSFREQYLRAEIQLEMGPLAAWVPNDRYSIIPYAAEVIPNIFQRSSARVRAIKAERTFWEKATILHQEAHRPEGKPQPVRYSRHYYDLAMISHSDIKIRAFEQLPLLRSVVDFKRKFYPSSWAHYELARPGTLRLVPPMHIRRIIQTDYREMQIMIFGEAPAFENAMEDIQELEEEINSLPG